MKVFLTGATGYIGSTVADRLRAAGHELTGLARSDAAADKLTATGIRPVQGVLEDIERGSYARVAGIRQKVALRRARQ